MTFVSAVNFIAKLRKRWLWHSIFFTVILFPYGNISFNRFVTLLSSSPNHFLLIIIIHNMFNHLLTNQFQCCLPINLLNFSLCIWILLANHSNIPSASISVDVLFQFRKQLCFGGFSFFIWALWHTEQYLFRTPTNKTFLV